MIIPKEDLKNYIGKKISCKLWSDYAYITPIAMGNRYMLAVNELGEEWQYQTGNEIWEIYEEPKEKPKKKVRKWLWDYEVNILGDIGYNVSTKWMSLEEAEKIFKGYNYRKTLFNGQEVWRDDEE